MFLASCLLENPKRLAENVLQALNEMDHITVPTQQIPLSTHHFPQPLDNVNIVIGHREGCGLH